MAPCIFFQNGVCVKGSSCHFKHDERSISEDVQVAIQLRDFVADQGGSMNAAKILQFYAIHPDARAIVGKPKTFCQSHSQLLLYEADAAVGPGTIRSIPKAQGHKKVKQNDSVAAVPHSSDHSHAASLAVHLMTLGGSMPASQLSQFYSTHPDAKPIISGRVHNFCTQHSNLLRFEADSGCGILHAVMGELPSSSTASSSDVSGNDHHAVALMWKDYLDAGRQHLIGQRREVMKHEFEAFMLERKIKPRAKFCKIMSTLQRLGFKEHGTWQAMTPTSNCAKNAIRTDLSNSGSAGSSIEEQTQGPDCQATLAIGQENCVDQSCNSVQLAGVRGAVPTATGERIRSTDLSEHKNRPSAGHDDEWHAGKRDPWVEAWERGDSISGAALSTSFASVADAWQVYQHSSAKTVLSKLGRSSSLPPRRTAAHGIESGPQRGAHSNKSCQGPSSHAADREHQAMAHRLHLRSYDLADFVKYKNRHRVFPERILAAFPDSIVAHYIQTGAKPGLDHGEGVPDYDALNKVTPFQPMPPRDALVLHLRTGDVCDKTGHNPPGRSHGVLSARHLLTHTVNDYVKPLPFFYEVALRAAKKGVKRITIITDRLEYGSVSEEYAQRVAEYFRTGKSPYADYCLEPLQQCWRTDTVVWAATCRRFWSEVDMQFTFGANARTFATTGGGFGKVLSELVQMRGGEVLYITDYCLPPHVAELQERTPAESVPFSHSPRFLSAQASEKQQASTRPEVTATHQDHNKSASAVRASMQQANQHLEQSVCRLEAWENRLAAMEAAIIAHESQVVARETLMNAREECHRRSMELHSALQHAQRHRWLEG